MGDRVLCLLQSRWSAHVESHILVGLHTGKKLLFWCLTRWRTCMKIWRILEVTVPLTSLWNLPDVCILRFHLRNLPYTSSIVLKTNVFKEINCRTISATVLVFYSILDANWVGWIISVRPLCCQRIWKHKLRSCRSYGPLKFQIKCLIKISSMKIVHESNNLFYLQQESFFWIMLYNLVYSKHSFKLKSTLASFWFKTPNKWIIFCQFYCSTWLFCFFFHLDV